MRNSDDRSASIMNPQKYKFDFAVDDEYITVKWELLPGRSDLVPYPELQIRFQHSDISKDTVQAMLQDMFVPESLCKVIMTRINAYAK